MKILHITNSYAPAWETGGVARVAYELTQKQVEQGHNVTVIALARNTSRHKYPFNEVIKLNGVNVIYLNNIVEPIQNTKAFVPTPRKFNKALPETVDIIHIHEHRSMMFPYSIIYAARKSIGGQTSGR
jgi:glycosyltransferase involved in cell wall biosynthesis